MPKQRSKIRAKQRLATNLKTQASLMRKNAEMMNEIYPDSYLQQSSALSTAADTSENWAIKIQQDGNKQWQALIK